MAVLVPCLVLLVAQSSILLVGFSVGTSEVKSNLWGEEEEEEYGSLWTDCGEAGPYRP